MHVCEVHVCEVMWRNAVGCAVDPGPAHSHMPLPMGFGVVTCGFGFCCMEREGMGQHDGEGHNDRGCGRV